MLEGRPMSPLYPPKINVAFKITIILKFNRGLPQIQ